MACTQSEQDQLVPEPIAYERMFKHYNLEDGLKLLKIMGNSQQLFADLQKRVYKGISRGDFEGAANVCLESLEAELPLLKGLEAAAQLAGDNEHFRCYINRIQEVTGAQEAAEKEATSTVSKFRAFFVRNVKKPSSEMDAAAFAVQANRDNTVRKLKELARAAAEERRYNVAAACFCP
ncbi:hypothetical protein MMC19_000834 [Ptychographa xylographoides]|nr:hypothetical protein [Ptychographa xylographoides]